MPGSRCEWRRAQPRQSQARYDTMIDKSVVWVSVPCKRGLAAVPSSLRWPYRAAPLYPSLGVCTSIIGLWGALGRRLATRLIVADLTHALDSLS
ncbi:unnamed protein product [Clonostachys byssicola]|uniref:Uncharacterized protein n=1 Tax=Clonostachys byssicola TaxID=160290 RepID=A0A9N9TYP6_9HYPO|nr:unnamed protein product [Clonostachys byssicola]